MNKYDAYEITPMNTIGWTEDNKGICEPADDAGLADFWSLFGHIKGQGVECIADFPTKDAAIISLMTTALGNAQDVLNNMGRSCYADVDWVAIREALRFAKEKL